MQNKLKKDELVRIVGQLQMIEKLPRGVLQQLARVFKVSDPSAPSGQLISQFRAKIVDIFIQEADGFMDYLQLPKFRALGSQASQKMYSVFQTAWNEYRDFKLKQQASQTRKQIQDLTPSFNSQQKMEFFHLSLLQLYRDSSVCPKNSKTVVKINNQPKNSPPQMTNFLYPNQTHANQTINNVIPNQIPHSMYPIFPFSHSPNYPKIEPQDGNPYILDPKMHVNNTPQGALFDMARFGMQHHPSYFANHQQLYQPVSRIQQVRKTDQTLQKNLFSESFAASLGYFARYEFIQCVCAGQAGFEGRDSFKCTLCSFSYHLQCMKIEKSPSIGAICPLCILRRETIFCKVNLEPMKFKWHFNERGRQLKVEMTEQESHEIYEARRIGLDCQIRFLKIDGKSLRRQKKPLDGYSSCNGYLQKTAKHTEITLPQLSQDRNQPISLEIVLRSQDDTDNSAPKLYLFAVFLITNKKVDEIINDLFNSQDYTTEEYYKDFMTNQDKVVVSLQGQSFSRGQIKYPVRGDSCHHLEVFDLKPYLQIVSDLKKENDAQLNCPICSNSCSFFRFDRFIYNAIQNFNQYDQTAPDGICIMSNGQYLWVGQNLEEQEDNAMQNQDEPMDEEPSHQEEQQQQA